MEISAIIIFLILSFLTYKLLCGYMMRSISSDKSGATPATKELATGCFVFFAMGLTFYGITLRYLCTTPHAIASFAISLLLALVFFLLPITDNIGQTRRKTIPKLYRLYCVLLSFALCSPLNTGVIAFCRWIYPDVTTVECLSGKYAATKRYAVPFTDGLIPTGSYIDNKTEDTLYRVVVSYALLGEEINNHYNVTDTIIPFSTKRIPCPPNYTARRIFPVMLPSHSRFGKHRTRRSYIATGTELKRFESQDFSCLGIRSNIRVDSFNITSNPIIWEDPQKLNTLERTIDTIMRQHTRSNKKQNRSKHQHRPPNSYI